MKKVIVLVVLLMVVVFGAMAQETYRSGGYVDAMTGRDWVEMSEAQRFGYLQGWYSAYVSIWRRMIQETFEGEPNDVASAGMEELFYIDLSVDQLLDLINNAYSYKSNLDYEIIEVIMVETGKDYWNY